MDGVCLSWPTFLIGVFAFYFPFSVFLFCLFFLFYFVGSGHGEETQTHSFIELAGKNGIGRRQQHIHFEEETLHRTLALGGIFVLLFFLGYISFLPFFCFLMS